jgi:hypothetical protein
VSKVLGKLLNDDPNGPRGPDVVHRIRVPSGWLDQGATIEFEVPRNLTCAQCGGGGCDACQRAGAITLRGREEPGEVVQVTLPQRDADGDGTARDVVLRIPGRGGIPGLDSDLPRGVMMLRISSAEGADDKVWRTEPSLIPGASERAKRASPEVAKRSLVIAALLILLFIFMLKLSGWL